MIWAMANLPVPGQVNKAVSQAMLRAVQNVVLTLHCMTVLNVPRIVVPIRLQDA